MEETRVLLPSSTLKTVVTASINNVSFKEPVPNGSILTIVVFKVSELFNTSMEVY